MDRNRKIIASVGIWSVSLLVAFTLGKSFSSKEGSGEQGQGDGSVNRSSHRGSSSSGGRSLPSGLSSLDENAEKDEIILAIARHHDPASRSRAILSLIDTLGVNDFSEVVAHLEETGLLESRMPEYRLLLSSWAQVAPEDAIDYASEKVLGAEAQNIILESWAATDAQEALQWAKDNFSDANPDVANPFLIGVIRGAAASDMNMAKSLLESLPASESKDQALDVILGGLHSESPSLAREWALVIEDGEFRSKALAEVAKKMALTDPVEAANWMASLNDADAFTKSAENLARQQYLNDPEAAKAWIQGLPVWAVGEGAAVVANLATNDDPLETAQWMSDLMNTNPDGNYDGAIETLVEKAAQEDPQISAEWIIGLSSNRGQDRLYHKVLSDWISNDKETAIGWIEDRADSLPEPLLIRYLPGYIPEVDPMNADESLTAE